MPRSYFLAFLFSWRGWLHTCEGHQESPRRFRCFGQTVLAWASALKTPPLKRMSSLLDNTEELANLTRFKCRVMSLLQEAIGMNSFSSGYLADRPQSVFSFLPTEHFRTLGDLGDPRSIILQKTKIWQTLQRLSTLKLKETREYPVQYRTQIHNNSVTYFKIHSDWHLNDKHGMLTKYLSNWNTAEVRTILKVPTECICGHLVRRFSINFCENWSSFILYS